MGEMFEKSSACILDLIFFVLAGKEDNYKSLDEFEFRLDLTNDCSVSCPLASE